MPTDFRDGKTFPRRGREPLGEFLWLARVFDKARAKANRTHDGYIYPCPMDRRMMQCWGIDPREFTAAINKHQSDEQILAWISQQVTPDRVQTANDWLLRQRSSLDRQDADEKVPGAVSPGLPWRDIFIGAVVAALAWFGFWWILRLFHA